MPNILIIDDELSMREFLKVLLEKEGYGADTAANAQDALTAVEGRDYDLIISDIKMPEMSGIEFLEQIRSAGLTMPVILITAYASPEDAVAAMKGGAYDYITKPFNVGEIKEIIHSALLTARNRNTAAQPAGETFQGIIAQSPGMLKIFDLIRRISPTHANVLIQGESGTGKELVARAVHNLSKAADHAFVPIICNAIPESLFESEVFGHVKGSFTGAVSNKQGLFSEADRGSVFLDEVGELTPLVQTKLLRVIQEREFKPVGGSHTIKVNIRVITATNRNLEQEVITGRFREDLFYRLSVVPIRVPPLRERKGDVPLLVDYFLKKYSRLFAKEISALSSYSMEVLMNYDFPGNVRELENIIERGVAMESSNIILPESLSIASHRQAAQSQPGTKSADDDFALGLEQAVENLERRLLRKALAQAGGSKMKAAELLKISFRSLRYKIKKYGIDNDNAR